MQVANWSLKHCVVVKRATSDEVQQRWDNMRIPQSAHVLLFLTPLLQKNKLQLVDAMLERSRRLDVHIRYHICCIVPWVVLQVTFICLLRQIDGFVESFLDKESFLFFFCLCSFVSCFFCVSLPSNHTSTTSAHLLRSHPPTVTMSHARIHHLLDKYTRSGLVDFAKESGLPVPPSTLSTVDSLAAWIASQEELQKKKLERPANQKVSFYKFYNLMSTRTSTRTSTHTSTHVHTHTHTHMQAHTRARTCKHTRIHATHTHQYPLHEHAMPCHTPQPHHNLAHAPHKTTSL